MIHLTPNRSLAESNACHKPGGSGGGQFCGSANHAGFLADLDTKGFQNPLNHREFVVGSEAGVELTQTSDGFRINAIRSFAPQSGAGTRTMQTLFELADKHKIVLTGGAKPFNTGQKNTLKKTALVDWYKRLGFTIHKNGEMTRDPK
jgi:hypothetical protein